ncbi:hypothetical protein [Okeania sp. KiyG1]|nr:hypothetical protein [Okeania sp. KiyG1]
MNCTRLSFSQSSSFLATPIIMINIDQIQQDINELPDEAQIFLIDFT